MGRLEASHVDKFIFYSKGNESLGRILSSRVLLK